MASADIDQYLTDRQAKRFSQMAGEVHGMMQKYPATHEVSGDQFGEERKALRRGGYNQQEEDAIMNVFAKASGSRSSVMQFQAIKPSYAEGEKVAPGEAYTPDTENKANPPGPKIAPPDAHQFYIDLLANQMRAGRTPLYGDVRPSIEAGFNL